MSTEVIKVRTPQEVPQAAAAGARAIRAGQLVGFATETVYGIAANAANPGSTERLRELKGRPERPFGVHLGYPEQSSRYVRNVPHPARRLMQRSWPGPVTLLLPTGGKLASSEFADLHDELTWRGTIGLRCPDEPVSRAMLSAISDPVVASSANLPGRQSPRNPEEVLAGLDGKIDLLIDSGQTALGTDSTIVLFDGADYRIVREGAVSAEDVERMIHRTYTFACTGNTCRSPMAEGIARTLLTRRLGCREGQLAKHGLELHSAGLFTFGGQPATPEAIAAAREYGADLSAHESRKLDERLIQKSDMIFCMTEHHAESIRLQAPQHAGKVRRLDLKADVPDPIGGDEGTYRRTAEHIHSALADLLDEGLL
ncbi:MAG: L-threonylcarbamoyladenylate synthase [Phycisphaerae bacterium]